MTADQPTATNDGSAVAATAVATASNPPRLTGPQLLTDALIDAISRGHCGWSRKQLEILGVPWPAQSGWRQRLVAEGCSLSAEQVERLYTARKPRRLGNPGGFEPDGSLTPMPCPWCRRLVEPAMQGGNLREFCCRKHKNSYNAALNRLSLTYARTIRVPGSLKIWAEQRVDPSESATEGLPQTTQGAVQQGSPSAPPRDEVQ